MNKLTLTIVVIFIIAMLIMFLPVKNQSITVLSILDTASLTQSQKDGYRHYREHDDAEFVPITEKNADGKIDTTFMLASRVQGVKLPAKAEIHSSLCGCSNSVEIK